MKKSKLVYVRYLDHVLFRNANPGQIKLIERETIGWLAKEDERSILLVWDRPVKLLRGIKEKSCSGLLILKSDLIEVRELSEFLEP